MTAPNINGRHLDAYQDWSQQAAARVLERCDVLATCSDAEGSILRTFLSPAMEQCHKHVRTWMEAAGMRVSLDTAGNLRGLLCAATPNARTLVLCSHLDTVPHSGKYDGVLGVVLAIALVEAVRAQLLPFAIEVIGFSDEEGVRFGLPFIGSRAVTETLQPWHLTLRDRNDVSLADALRIFGEQHRGAFVAALAENAVASLEFHIEQGPVLEAVDQSLAAVRSIAGQSRATVVFEGRAGHAGTTPMTLRQDALTAAAEWLLAVESIAEDTPGIVATCGRIQCDPGAPNVIPGVVRCTLDVRSSEDSLRGQSFEAMIETASRIAIKRRLRVSHSEGYSQPSVALDASLSALAMSCLDDQSAREPIVSGAGHDSMILAPHLPSAMIFLRSPGGISHHPDESVRPVDVAAALRAGMVFLQKFPAWINLHDGRKQEAPCIT